MSWANAGQTYNKTYVSNKDANQAVYPPVRQGSRLSLFG